MTILQQAGTKLVIVNIIFFLNMIHVEDFLFFPFPSSFFIGWFYFLCSGSDYYLLVIVAFSSSTDIAFT